MRKKTKLGDTIEFQRGYDLTHSQMIEGEYPVIGSNGIIGTHNTFKTSDSIVLGRSGTIGNPQIIKGKFWPHNTTLYSTDLKGNNLEYMYYLLKTLHIENYSSGSTVPTLNRNDLSPLEITIEVDTNKQKRISESLSLLDETISTNNKIISELESMAKDIYDYWFVQFDFPDENGKPYKSSDGKMVWNEELKREIPEGWKKSRFDEAFSIVMGSSPSGDSINVNNNGIVFFQGNADFGDKYPSPRTYSTNPIRFANKKDVLLSVRAPVGAINISYEKCCIGRGVAAISSSHPSFAYYTVKNSYPYFDIYNQSGTTFGCIGRDELGAIPCILPPKEVLERFEKTVEPASTNGYNLFIQNNELTSLRDFLLPLLMNGQVKIGDVEL